MYMKREGPTPFSPRSPENWMCGWGKMGKKVYEKRGKQVFVLTNWRLSWLLFLAVNASPTTITVN